MGAGARRPGGAGAGGAGEGGAQQGRPRERAALSVCGRTEGAGGGEEERQEAEDEIDKHETKCKAGEREGRSESLRADAADKRA